MRHEDLTNFRLPIERIVKRQNHAAGISEYCIYALLTQTRKNRLRASHFIRHPFVDRLVTHIITYTVFAEQVVRPPDLMNFFERHLRKVHDHL